jgi:hypothetical protein
MLHYGVVVTPGAQLDAQLPAHPAAQVAASMKALADTPLMESWTQKRSVSRDHTDPKYTKSWIEFK